MARDLVRSYRAVVAYYGKAARSAVDGSWANRCRLFRCTTVGLRPRSRNVYRRSQPQAVIVAGVAENRKHESRL
jgi:hypothetical protein